MDRPQSRLFLIWPDEFPQHSVEVDLDCHPRYFNFIRPRQWKTWDTLRGRPEGTIVLDPKFSAPPELLENVVRRGFLLVEGLEACCKAISLWLVSAAPPKGEE